MCPREKWEQKLEVVMVNLDKRDAAKRAKLAADAKQKAEEERRWLRAYGVALRMGSAGVPML